VVTTLKNWFRSFKKNLSVKKDQVTSTSSPWSIGTQGIDVMLLLLVLGMVLFGLIMVYSSSFIYAQEKTGDGFYFIRKQIIYAGLGCMALFTVCRLDYRRWAKWAYPVLGLAVFLLALVLVPGIGAKVGGARRWIHLGGMNFQPGEFAKFAVIFFVASQLDRKSERIDTVTAGVLSHFIVPLPALFLLLFQPDFGTTVMIVLVIFSLMFLAGVPGRYLLITLGTAATAGSWLAIGTAYRRTRIMTFLDPWIDPGGKGFQILQSFVGLHNGRLWGVGLGNGKEKLFYLPEAHNDFIGSVIGEELGFIGIAVVILAYVYFVYRGLKIAWNCQKQNSDHFGLLLASGITLALGYQGFVNIAVVLGLVPTKGLTLPFISYGGSALLVDLFAVGVLLSIARGEKKSSTPNPIQTPVSPREV
jgi:cell division protein FtsW